MNTLDNTLTAFEKLDKDDSLYLYYGNEIEKNIENLKTIKKSIENHILLTK